MKHRFENATARQITSKPIERVAIEIGNISIYWAWLENAIDNLIAALVPMEVDQVADAVMGNTDIRQKVQMIKALAFLERGQSLEWHADVVETINAIDNDLRSRRNLYVHSAWFTPKGRLHRQKKTIRISKPQSFQQPQLQTRESVPFKIREARKLGKDILAATKKIVFQTVWVRDADYCIMHEISYEQFLHEVALSVRRTRKKLRPKPQRRTPRG